MHTEGDGKIASSPILRTRTSVNLTLSKCNNIYIRAQPQRGRAQADGGNEPNDRKGGRDVGIYSHRRAHTHKCVRTEPCCCYFTCRLRRFDFFLLFSSFNLKLFQILFLLVTILISRKKMKIFWYLESFLFSIFSKAHIYSSFHCCKTNKSFM